MTESDCCAILKHTDNKKQAERKQTYVQELLLLFPPGMRIFSLPSGLFCYCPLYVLGADCGGSFTYLENGCKDCSRCLYPHRRENYEAVVGRFGDIQKAMAMTPKASS